MAYSNVGKPVFYIDNYLYHKTIGTALTVPPYTSNNFTSIDPQSNPEFFTLTPSIAKDITSLQVGGVLKAYIPMPPSTLDYDFSGNMKWYWASLNHNDTTNVNLGFVDEDGNSTYISSDFEEILNGQHDGSWFQPLDGSTIITYSGTPSGQHSYIWDSGDSTGAYSTGIQYTMPHSPDLKLTMDIEMDGVDTITTSGGGSISNIKYTGNPLWVNGENKTNPFDVYESTLDVTQVGARRNGRKSWSLKFSYVSDSDLFSSNLRASSYTEHPNDSTYNTSDLDGLDASGNPTSTSYLAYNIETDDSFYAQVWNKTLGGALPFMFQPDSNNRDDFYMCRFDQNSLRVSQSAYKVYDISLKIVESW